MNNLLNWAILNTATEGEDAKGASPARPLQELDPNVIDLILGKDDSTQMKEFVAVASSDLATTEQKELALEDLETLVGQIDNAQNLESLNLWEPLLDLLTSPDPRVRKGVAWVCGTAVQNHPKVKENFTRHGGLNNMVTVLEGDMDVSVKAKALYCLSSLLQNAPPLLEAFIKLNGIKALQSILTLPVDPSQSGLLNLQRRTLFTLRNLASQHPPFSANLRRSSFPPILLDVADRAISLEDEDLAEQSIRAYLVVLGHAPPIKSDRPILASLLPRLTHTFPEIEWSDAEKASIKRLTA
ncbi:MAG: armadillo-type protein [Piptocephalis tieghemiana]|nr:MAG: armadillo-type protein [Piptocephalis tieghemiana]